MCQLAHDHLAFDGPIIRELLFIFDVLIQVILIIQHFVKLCALFSKLLLPIYALKHFTKLWGHLILNLKGNWRFLTLRLWSWYRRWSEHRWLSWSWPVSSSGFFFWSLMTYMNWTCFLIMFVLGLLTTFEDQLLLILWMTFIFIVLVFLKAIYPLLRPILAVFLASCLVVWAPHIVAEISPYIVDSMSSVALHGRHPCKGTASSNTIHSRTAVVLRLNGRATWAILTTVKLSITCKASRDLVTGL